jgi:radical SAM superfamily enzyme YgiQ (UPF0313 family)
VKIALICPNLGNYRRSSDAMPPLAMAVLAARCGQHPYVFYDDRVETIPESLDADLVALSVETFTAHRAYQLADAFRHEGKIVVMGGYHPTFLPEEALQHADAVVRGDAEGLWEQLLLDAGRGKPRRVYQNAGLPGLAGVRFERGIFAGKRYAPMELVQYGRGCRFVCDFCSIHRFYGNELRMRPADELRAELQSLDRKRLLFFVDDNLFSGEASLQALLALLRPLKLRWACQISIDVAREPALLDQLAEAGCRYVLIGFESLEPANLRQMKKRWNHVSGDYLRVARNLHQRGIGIYGTFVFGYDHDTPDTIRRSLDFALEARLEIANFNPLTPTPGSLLYERLRDEHRLLSPHWWIDPQYRYGDPIFIPRGMPADTLAQACFEAKKQFYVWSSITRRVLLGDQPFSWFNLLTASTANLISRREVYRKQGRVLGA